MSLIMRAWLSRGRHGFVGGEEEGRNYGDEYGAEEKKHIDSEDEGGEGKYNSDSDSDSNFGGEGKLADESDDGSESDSDASMSSLTDLQIYRSSLSAQTAFTVREEPITYFNIVKMLWLIFPRGDVGMVRAVEILKLLGLKGEKILTSNHINYIQLYKNDESVNGGGGSSSKTSPTKMKIEVNVGVLRWKWLVGKRLESEKLLKHIKYDIFIRLCYLLNKSPKSIL
ncbi:hypothetical protein TrLO_g2483 [Triparma laevis f. longispina]|nr:hypothetical protein TrLO_g2483 [Triparma laevis f. longispina]